MEDTFFRKLTPSEEIDFRLWARQNWKIGDPISELWHPIVRDEIKRIIKEEKERKTTWK